MNPTFLGISDTIVAIATPPGLGAIAVLRLAGNDAWPIANRFFKGKKSLLSQKSHSTHFGSLVDMDDKLLDEVLISLFKNPHSYTGDDIVEISCHGSTFIQQQILTLFLKNGARLARPGEFTQRAFLNGKMDLTQAEAVGDLIAAQNAAAHQVAIRQMRGGFSSKIKNLREELIMFAALIELELDFAEEDVEFANRLKINQLVENIRAEIALLTASFQLGNALKNGVSTVIAGRPNAGKSTLLNAMLNENRAIVHELAGTTRDAIEEILTLEGIQFRLIDTAGIREATDAIEKIGIEKTMEKVSQAAILIYIFDVVQTCISEVFDDLKNLHRPDLQLLVVANKMDLLPQFRPEWLENPHNSAIPDFILGEKITADFSISASQIITLSAKHEMNLPYLKEKLVENVAGGKIDFESTIITNARHVEALQRADSALLDVQIGFRDGISSDFVAQDIRRALAYLGEISGGTIHADDLLSAIFSKFCIGK